MLDFDHPPADPIAQYHAWYADARQIGLGNPNAACLATIDPDGRPSARIVLVKQFDADGAVFYTNRESRKGRALEANPVATMVHHWDALERQIVLEGTISHARDEESDAYFASRPRASQIGAWASVQSQPVADRAALDAAYAEAEARFDGGDVPRPPHWGGYRLTFTAITFWQGQPFRLHDRIVYRPDGSGGWTIERLFP